MTATSTPPMPVRALMVQRARWLRAMSPHQRDALAERPLREVDARFERWLSTVASASAER